MAKPWEANLQLPTTFSPILTMASICGVNAPALRRHRSNRFHRDNAAPGAIETFQDDVYHGVVEVYAETHPSRLHRVDAVMKHAGLTHASPYSAGQPGFRKTGMCHHLANEGRLKWTS